MDEVSMTMNRWLVLGWAFFTLGVARAADAGAGLRSPELAAQPQAETTAEQRQQILATTRALERSAFSVGASTEREKVLWLIDHGPDIFPRLQDSIVGEISNSGVPDWRPIYAQFIFGFVGFQIENPQRANDPVAVYEAAMRSCLLVYRQAVQRDKANRLAVLETANEEERNGRLRKYVADRVQKFAR